MCGIAGFVITHSTPEPERLMEQMARAMHHRGPDGHGVHVQDGVALGHRRLSIIDLAQGGQPMHGHRGESIVFNGEIYNYKELRARYQERGYRFVTNSDTEVILAAWQEDGEHCLDAFIGMFAFAIRDPQRGVLFLARDRFGKKPLFYLQGQGEFAFASEIKALAPHPWLRRNASICQPALLDYLTHGYIPAPRSILEQVRKLPAAHCATLPLAGGELRIRRYWDAAASFLAPKEPLGRQSARSFLELLDDAVKLRMRSDVPVGAFLSGGMDSSAVVSGMRAHSSEAIRAFCVSFSEDSFDETPYAREVAEHLGVELECIPQPAGDLATLCRLVWHVDEPFCDNSMIPTYQISAATKRFATVVLTGDGADEVLAGYPTYRANAAYPYYALFPAWLQRMLVRGSETLLRPSYRKVSMDYALRRFLRSSGLTPAQAHASWRMIFDPAEQAELLSDEFRAAQSGHDPFEAYGAAFGEVRGADFLDQSLYADIKVWLQDDILVKADRMSMAASLELRSPFLDHRVVEFLAALPPQAKMQGLRQKVILKEVMSQRLPQTTLARKKRGFNHPAHLFASHGLCPHGPEGVFRAGYALDPRREDVTYKAFCLLVLRLWMRMFERYKSTGQWLPPE